MVCYSELKQIRLLIQKNIGFITEKKCTDKSEHIPIGNNTVAIFQATK